MQILEQNEKQYYARYQCSLQEMASGIELQSINSTLYDNLDSINSEKLSIPKDVRLLIILGFGDGCMVNTLLTDMDDEVSIIIYEPDRVHFLYTCMRNDISMVIGRPNLEIVFGDGDIRKLLENGIRRITGVLNIQHMFFKALPGYAENYPDLDKETIEAVKEILMSQAAEYVTEISYSRAIYKNQLYALSVMHFNSLFSDLLNVFPDREMPIILVGAGPSLNKNAAALGKVDGNALVIACTRAMSTLDKNGVDADLVAMVDMEEGHDFCEHDTDRQYRLLFHSQSAADIQKEYVGRGIYFGFQKERYPLKGFSKEIDDFSTGGSVITCIFSVFMQAGFKKFILVGEDLAYSEEGKTHSGNFQEQTKEKIFQTESINGGMIKTRSDWQIFRAFFEQEIEAHPEVEVIDATEGGALIHGSKVMTLEEAVDNLSNRSYRIREKLNYLPVGFNNDLIEIKAFYDRIVSQCGEMQYLLKEAILWNDRIRNMEAESAEGMAAGAFQKYNDLYLEIVDDNKADTLKGYAADAVYAYTDKAQYYLADEQYAERLDLEKEFFNNLLTANIELVEYVSVLKSNMIKMTGGIVLQANENAFRKRYGKSLRDMALQTELTDYRPVGEDEYYATEGNDNSGAVLLWLIFGIGKGEVIRKLIVENTASTRFMIYEPNVASFLELTRQTDISDIIADERVAIILGKEELNKGVEESFGHANLEHKKILCNSAAAEINKAEIEGFLKVIGDREAYLRRAGFSWEYLGENLCMNELYALSQVNNNYLVSDLFENIPDRNIPVILVAAGPSLRKNADFLKKAYGKAIIVAAAHAWPVLEEKGICVDFIARHDGMQGKDTGFLKADESRSQRLLLAASSGYEIQKEYNGRCYYYGFSADIFRDDRLKNNYLSENRGGSIATDVFELFAAAGFKNIILVGQDLAYGTDGQSHASGSNSNEYTDTGRLETEGINGERIRTRDDWLMFLRFYEKLISENPELKIIDATEGGARIRGTRIMPLSEAINELCASEYPVSKWIDSTLKAGCIHGIDIGGHSLIEQLEYIDEIRKQIREILILSDRISVRLRIGQTDDPEFLKDCESYDRLYHKILDGEEAALLCYYAQAEIQNYIKDALLVDCDALAKLENENKLFEKLQAKCINLGALMDKNGNASAAITPVATVAAEEKEPVDALIKKVRNFYDGDHDCLPDLYNMMCDYMELPMEYRKSNSNKLCKEMLTMIVSKPLKVPYFMLSSVLEMTENKDVFQHLLHLCIDDEKLTKENRHYIYYQMVRYKFVHPEVNTKENNSLMDDLYEKIYQAYKEELGDCLFKIHKEERNKDFVIVLATQVLTINHGPTKVLFDRCYILEEFLGKKVYIINTAEMMSPYGEMEWFGATEPNYYDSYEEHETMDYKGKSFAFFQCPREMPQVEVIRQILHIIQDAKPWCVVAIDGACITADMCAEIVPTITINLSNDRAVTRTTFQMLSHVMNKEDENWLKKHNYSDYHFINGIFTFALKEQTCNLTREILGIPEDKIVCVVTGGRLDMELTIDFIEMISKLAEKDIYTVFVGDYKKYEEVYECYPVLEDHLIGLGYQNDTLAVNECCDIYVNPKRSGGGTSAVEAMYKGLPVVTENYGDVAIAAGEDFIVADYNEMYDEVIRLSEDKDYYSEKSLKARKRAERLTDSKGEFMRIMHEMENSALFF